MYFDQIHNPFITLSNTPFEIILTGFLILFSYMCIKYFSHIHHPLLSVLSFSSFPLITTTREPLFYTSSIQFFKDYTPHMRENVWYLSFSLWIIMLNMIISSSIYFHTNNMMLSFFRLNNTTLCACVCVCVCVCMCVTFLYPFICWWTQADPMLGYCD
jgi:hypothetical protein